MTKADLVEHVADAVGPRVTKRDCGLVIYALSGASGRIASRPSLGAFQKRLAGADSDDAESGRPSSRSRLYRSRPSSEMLQNNLQIFRDTPARIMHTDPLQYRELVA